MSSTEEVQAYKLGNTLPVCQDGANTRCEAPTSVTIPEQTVPSPVLSNSASQLWAHEAQSCLLMLTH